MSKLSSIAAAAVCAVACTLAQADAVRFVADLSGANEVPANASSATGLAVLDYDDTANTLRVQGSFSGLTSPATAAHIHCCIGPSGNAGVAIGLVGFPNATASFFDIFFDLSLTSTYGAAFLGASGGTAALAEARLFSEMSNGMTYVNIHNQPFPGGEIRGQIRVPEPTSLALMALSLAALGATSRRKSA